MFASFSITDATNVRLGIEPTFIITSANATGWLVDFAWKKKWIIKKTIDVAFTLQLPRMFTCPSLVFRRPLFSISAQRFGLWYGQYRTVIIWIKVEGTYRNYNRIRLSSKISVYCYYSCGVIDFKWFLRVTGCNMKQWNSKICLSIKDLFS